MAARLGLEIEFVPGDWRHGADPEALEAKLAPTRTIAIKAVCVVHNETSTGVTSRIADVRKAIDDAKHPALLLVDTISSLASIDYRHDEWGVDVTVAGSQKGLMLPPGLSFNAVSDKALAAHEEREAAALLLGLGGRCWRPTRPASSPTRPATNLLYGLREAIAMLREEGLENVFARHDRHAEATRRAVRGVGPRDPVRRTRREYSGVADRGDDAGGPRRRCVPRDRSSSISTCRLGAGPGQAQGQGVPHRPSRRFQRPAC